MREQGRVVEVRDTKAVVEIHRKKAGGCSGCSLCDLTDGRRTLEIDAPDGVHAGDTVDMEIPMRPVVVSVVVLLVAPLALLVAGVLVGGRLFPADGGDGEINVPALALGVALLSLWYVGVWVVEKKTGAKSPPQPRIVGVHHASR